MKERTKACTRKSRNRKNYKTSNNYIQLLSAKVSIN